MTLSSRWMRAVRCIALVLAAGVVALGASAQTLNIGAATTPSIDPHFMFLNSNVAYARHVFDPLTRFEHGKLEPALAVSWKAVTPTQWEFKLRPNVKFHDGTPFTADDVAFSFKRLATLPNNPISYAGGIGSVKEVTAVDPLTVRIDTVLPEPMLPVNISIVSIASKKAAEGAGAAEFNSGKAAIGTGPYKFSSYAIGERYEVVRNDAYWGAKPYWQKVVFRIITQDASRIAALLAGEVDLIDAVPPADAAKLRTNPAVAVHQGPTYRYYLLSAFLTPERNHWITDKAGKPLAQNPMRDLRVRQAISEAIDRKAIVTRVMDGAADVVNQLASASMPAYDKTLPPIPYDPVAAKKLLAEAGYPDGFAMTIHCSNDRYPNDARVCQTVGQMLARIGIEMKVETQPKAIYFAHLLPPKGDYALGLIGVGTLDGSTATGLNAIVHTYDPPKKAGIFNVAGYSNPAIDAKIEELSSEFDPAKRLAMESALLRDVAKELPVIPLYSGSVVLASKRSIAYTPRPDEYTLAMDAKPVQ